MSRRLMKICIAAALVVAAFGSVSSASATTFTTNGNATGAAFSGQAVGGGLLSVTSTGAGLQGILCTTATNTGKLFGPSSATGAGLATVSLAFSSCTAAGQPAAVKCNDATLNAVSYTAATNVTTGNVTGISCVITKSACGNSTSVTGGITVTGTLAGTYGNTSQQLSIPTANSLAVSWPSAGCLAGTSPGSGMLTNTSGTALTAGVTSAFKPQVKSP